MKKIFMAALLALCPWWGEAIEGYRLVCDEPIYDFGQIDPSTVLTNVFVIRNEGDLTFALKRIRTSCGCTRARLDPPLIGPGETARVSVVFDAARRRGSQKKSIWIFPRDARDPALILYIQGFVEGPTP